MHTRAHTQQWIIGSNQVPHNRIYLPLSHKALVEMSTLLANERQQKHTHESRAQQANKITNTYARHFDYHVIAFSNRSTSTNISFAAVKHFMYLSDAKCNTTT